jgi:hypothetical protein
VAAVIKAVRNKGFRDFSFVCRELAALTGNDMKTVIDNEVGAILQATVAGTKVAAVNKIIADHNRQEWVTYDIPYGGAVKGREGYFASKAAARRSSGSRNALLYKQTWRMPQWLWSEIRSRRAASLQRKIANAGVAAKHWYEQAIRLGYKISVDPRVKNAANRSPLAVETSRSSDPNKYAVEGRNFSELSNRYADGSNALARAVAKRVNLFQRSMRQWAQGKVNLVAKKYPDLIRVS